MITNRYDELRYNDANIFSYRCIKNSNTVRLYDITTTNRIEHLTIKDLRRNIGENKQYIVFFLATDKIILDTFIKLGFKEIMEFTNQKTNNQIILMKMNDVSENSD